MATVHPSRLGMVRNAHVVRASPPTREEELKQQLLERRRSKSNGHSHERADQRNGDRSERHGDVGRRDDRRSRTSDRELDESRDRRSFQDSPRRQERSRPNGHNDEYSRDERRSREDNGDRDHDRHRRRGDSRGRAEDQHERRRRPRDEYDRAAGRERDEDRLRDGNGDDVQRSRRASPSYRDYDGPPPPPHSFPPFPPTNAPNHPPPWAGNSNGGPMRMGFDRPPRQAGNGFINSAELERRRVERENMVLSVWPPSPKQPYVDEDELDRTRKDRKRLKKSSSKRSKRRHRYSEESSSETDSEEEERRRRRRRRREKEKEREQERETRPRSYTPDDERDRKRRKPSDEPNGDADLWVEKGGEAVSPRKQSLVEARPLPIDEDVQLSPSAVMAKYEVDEDEVGPQLPIEHVDRIHRSAYSHMLRGEGEAMAAFAASGQRIPRRGEIGLESDQIEAFEHSGYVMSGSRHRRMNAVRMRKENQVINAEEKRAILKLQREEREKKEGAIIGQFREMLDDRLVHVQNQVNQSKQPQ